MSSRLFFITVATLGLGLASTNVRAQSGIFINGVRVNGLKNHTFQNCQVQFDAAGNVHITAKGFKIKAVPQSSQARKLPPTIRHATPTPPPTRTAPVRRKPPPSPKKAAPAKHRYNPSLSYFLVAQTNKPGHVQYDVDVYINRTWIRKIRSRDSQVVFKVNRYLKVGKNVVNFAATKNFGNTARLSNSPSDFIRILIGTGTKGGGTVNITEGLVDFRVSADKSKNFNQEMILSH